MYCMHKGKEMHKLYLQFEVVQDLTDVKIVTEQHITSNLSINSRHRNCDMVYMYYYSMSHRIEAPTNKVNDVYT